MTATAEQMTFDTDIVPRPIRVVPLWRSDRGGHVLEAWSDGTEWHPRYRNTVTGDVQELEWRQDAMVLMWDSMPPRYVGSACTSVYRSWVAHPSNHRL